MSADAHSHVDVPVRASETLAAVVAALAVEQIATGSFERLNAMKDSLEVGGIILRFFLPIALVLTTVRLVHGNVVHLAVQYRRWHHREVPQHALVAVPIGHFIDVAFHLLQYLCLVATGYFLAKDLKLVAVSVAVLLLIHALWIGIFAALNRGLAETTKATLRGAALVSGLAFLSVLAISVCWFLAPSWSGWLEATLTFTLLAAVAADYGLNYEHFFKGNRSRGYGPHPPTYGARRAGRRYEMDKGWRKACPNQFSLNADGI